MTEKKQAVLRSEQLKAFYVLEMHGRQKVIKAVNDVDMTIYENEIYGIAGESGCGKTTLLKALFHWQPPRGSEPRRNLRIGLQADPTAGLT